MKFSHPLMHNNFTKDDINSAINVLRQKKRILTQSKYVKKFENNIECKNNLDTLYSTTLTKFTYKPSNSFSFMNLINFIVR